MHSVAGKSGDVILVHTNITNWTAATASLGAVQSVAGKVGAVTLVHGDITDWTAATASLVPTSANIISGLGYTPYDAANPSNYQTASQVSATLGNYVPLSQRAAVNGVATLDGTGIVPTMQLPGAVTGTLTYMGGWNACTNTPAGLRGAGWRRAASRRQLLSGQRQGLPRRIDGMTTWTAGDWISSNGTIWQRVQNSTSPYLPLTGGNLSGTVTGPVFALTNSDTIRGPTTTPDIAPFQIEDASGNLAVSLDTTNTLNGYGLNFSTAALASATVTGTATLGTTAATVLSVAGDTVSAMSTQPDLVTIEAQDATGNIISGYSSDGYLNVVGIKATQGIQIAGSVLGEINARLRCARHAQRPLQMPPAMRWRASATPPRQAPHSPSRAMPATSP